MTGVTATMTMIPLMTVTAHAHSHQESRLPPPAHTWSGLRDMIASTSLNWSSQKATSRVEL